MSEEEEMAMMNNVVRRREPPLMKLEPEAANAIAAYGPPEVRRNAVPHEEPTIKQVAQFAELPTKEIDEIITAAKQEIEELERNAQKVRDLYMRATDRITADIRRLREGVRLSMGTLQQLRDHCTQLNVEPMPGAQAEKVIQSTERELRDLAKSDDSPAQ